MLTANPPHPLSLHSYFITVEGIEGAGKTTAIQFIANYLRAQNIPLVVTREPGGTPVAEAIRHLLLTQPHDETLATDTELLLMFASRAQHIATVIRPALARQQWVLCDRFTDASYAYQGGGRGIPRERIAILEKWVQGELQPDLTLLLDVPAAVGLTRIKDRKTQDRIEREQEVFFTCVRQIYLERAQCFPQRFKIIDASVAVPQVQEQLVEVLQGCLQNNNSLTTPH